MADENYGKIRQAPFNRAPDEKSLLPWAQKELVPFLNQARGAVNWLADHLGYVRVVAGDALGLLRDKLVAGTNVTIVQTGTAADATLTISADTSGADANTVATDSTDRTAGGSGYLLAKCSSSGNVTPSLDTTSGQRRVRFDVTIPSGDDHEVKADSTDTGHGDLLAKLVSQDSSVAITAVTVAGIHMVNLQAEGVPATIPMVDEIPGGTTTTENLVPNPGAETGTDTSATGWTGTGVAMTRIDAASAHEISVGGDPVQYLDVTIPRACGLYVFFPHTLAEGGQGTIHRSVDVSAYATQIDTGDAHADVSAWLSSFMGPTGTIYPPWADTVQFTVQFISAGAVVLNSVTVGPAGYDNAGTHREIADVPAGTRTLNFVLTFVYTGHLGAWCAAYADNLSCRLILPGNELDYPVPTIVALVDDLEDPHVLDYYAKVGPAETDWLPLRDVGNPAHVAGAVPTIAVDEYGQLVRASARAVIVTGGMVTAISDEGLIKGDTVTLIAGNHMKLVGFDGTTTGASAALCELRFNEDLHAAEPLTAIELEMNQDRSTELMYFVDNNNAGYFVPVGAP